jgi:ComF family protein
MNNIIKIFTSYLSDFLALFYPNYCSGCGNSLIKGEQCLCSHCLVKLPKTYFHLQKNNPVEMLFAGRIPVFRATAFCSFHKESIVQHLIHQLKYKGKKEVGTYLGFLFGTALLESEDFQSIDLILPIPLHPRKKEKRGYNQSEAICDGIAKGMQKEQNHSLLVRTKDTKTQTKKSRYKRWENVSEIFKILHPEKLEGKHVLLVDDVVTTGATLEAAGQILLEIPNTKISIASLAWAN